MSKRVQTLRLERDHWKWRAEVAEKRNKERQVSEENLVEVLIQRQKTEGETRYRLMYHGEDVFTLEAVGTIEEANRVLEAVDVILGVADRQEKGNG